MDRRLRCCRIALVAAFALTGCSSTSAGTSGIRSEFVPALARANAVSPGNYIKHVIVIIQENRSFDNMFEGFPGAETKTFGYQSNGTLTPLRPIDITSSIDPAHGLENALVDYDGGKMDAFDKPPGNPNNPYAPIGSYAYAYIPRSEVAPYWSLARQYVLADHMFPSEWGGSFTAHLYLIAGTAELTPTTTEADNPFGTTNGAWGCDSPSGTATDTWDVEGQEQSNGPFPCFSQFNTMADLLDASGVSWKYYAPLVSPSGGNPGGFWSSFDAIANVRCGVNGPVTGPCTGTGGDWANVVSPETKVLTDITHGKLASVSWVVPDNANSDHPGTGSDTGPSWVASIVNAVGTSGADCTMTCRRPKRTTAASPYESPASSSRRTRRRITCRTPSTSSAAS